MYVLVLILQLGLWMRDYEIIEIRDYRVTWSVSIQTVLVASLGEC